jgi:hypothetical protein
MTARDEILAALPAICARAADGTFIPQDVSDELQRRGHRLSHLNDTNSRSKSYVRQRA